MLNLSDAADDQLSEELLAPLRRRVMGLISPILEDLTETQLDRFEDLLLALLSDRGGRHTDITDDEIIRHLNKIRTIYPRSFDVRLATLLAGQLDHLSEPQLDQLELSLDELLHRVNGDHLQISDGQLLALVNSLQQHK